MKMKKTAAMVVSAACLTVCAGMSMNASAAGASVSLPKDLSGIGTFKRAEEPASMVDSYKKVVIDYADVNSRSFFYAIVDWDDDGLEDLIICPTDEFEGRVAEVYSYDGESAVKIEEINEDFDQIFALYGATVKYNEDGTWTTVDENGEETDGIDMWLIESIDDEFVLPEIPADASPVEETLIVYEAFMRYAADVFAADETNTYLNYMEMYAFDMNKDGIPELIVKNGSCEADYVYDFMSYDPENDEMIYLVSDVAGHSALFMDTATGQLCSHYGDMGYGSITWYDYVDGEIVAQETAETFTYDEEDPYSAYAQYGDFVRVDSSMNNLDDEHKWNHFVGEDTFEGFDTSVFDRYLANYNAAQTPEETTAETTTTTTNSTTTATTTTGKTDSPKTGDNALPMLGAVITIAGLTAFTLRKKND